MYVFKLIKSGSGIEYCINNCCVNFCLIYMILWYLVDSDLEI